MEYSFQNFQTPHPDRNRRLIQPFRRKLVEFSYTMSILDTRKIGCKKEAIHKSLELNGRIGRRRTAAEHWDGDNSRRSGSFRPVARVTRISAMNLAGGPDETNAEPVHVVPIQCGSLTRLLITIVATDNEPNREKKWSALAGNINLWLSETMRREYNWT